MAFIRYVHADQLAVANRVADGLGVQLEIDARNT
jgi:hypothetical protein